MRCGMKTVYKELARYAYQDDRLGEEFFQGRIRDIRESAAERVRQIKRRVEVHEQNLRAIEVDFREANRRLEFLALPYAAERTTLMGALDSLRKESRNERVRFVQDCARFSEQLQEKREEYEGMKQLFSAMAVSRKPRERDWDQ